MRRVLSLVVPALFMAPALAAQVTAAEYGTRRTALAAKLGDGVFIARGAVEPVQDYLSFFQSPGFLYLTGYREANASLLMTKKGSAVSWTLFVEPKNPAVEVWSGRRNGADSAARMTGIPARLAPAFRGAADSAIVDLKKLFLLADLSEGGDTLNGDDAFLREVKAAHPGVSVASANAAVMQMRGTKSPAELELIRRAAAISLDAHREAARALRPGMNEFEIQALLEYTFRRNGGDRPAYSSIVGSGPNTTTLHYNKDDRFMNGGELLLIDAATTYGGYAADVTRTFPVNGVFTPAQREIYQIVRNAQAAAERQLKVGGDYRALNDSSRAVLAEGLARVGLIESPGATYNCGGTGQPLSPPRQCPQLGLYYMHGLGHGIGLEVHDPDQYYFTGKIGVGSAFSIEPGIYVRENLLDIIAKTPDNQTFIEKIRDAVAKYRNVGVRIEDNFIVTENGVEWVSCVPRDIDEVEAMMRDRAAGPSVRDAERVEGYQSTSAAPADGAKTPPKPKACALKM